MKRKLLTTNEVAQILGVKKYRVYTLIKGGLLPVVRLGRQVRIEEGKLYNWIENGGKSLPREGEIEM